MGGGSAVSGDCPLSGLLKEFVELLAESPSVVGDQRLVLPPVGVAWNGLVAGHRWWCVGALLGPETTPAGVCVLWSGIPEGFIPPTLVGLVAGFGGGRVGV